MLSLWVEMAPTPRGVLSDKGAESALSRHQISYSTPCILHILSTIALHSYLLNIDHCLNADHRHHDCFVILVLLLFIVYYMFIPHVLELDINGLYVYLESYICS